MVPVSIKQAVSRVALPAAFVVAAVIRPCVVSLIYLLLALTTPFFPLIKQPDKLPFGTRIHLIVSVLFSLIILGSQVVYQIVNQVTTNSDNDYARYCNGSAIFRDLGYYRIPTTVTYGLRFILPEVIAVIGAAVTLLLCSRKPEETAIEFDDSDLATALNDPSPQPEASLPTALVASFKRLSDIVISVLVAYLAVIQPSLINLVYFFIFLTTLTWYSLYRKFQRSALNALKCSVAALIFLNIIASYVLQIPSVRGIIGLGDDWERLIGLPVLIEQSDCKAWYQFTTPAYGAAYANYISLFVIYFVILYQSQWTHSGVYQPVASDGDSSLHEELLPPAGVSPNDVPLQRITSAYIDRQRISSMLKNENQPDGYPLVASFLFFCLKHVYVIVLLAMMIWAMIYHSVFGLIHLLLACFLWAVTDSRRYVLRVSPVLLAYAELLLYVQYIYSLDTNKLPTSNVLDIIGFCVATSRTNAIVTLVIKVLLSLPFFVVCRLFFRERFYNNLTEHDRRRRVDYGTFAGGEANNQSRQRSVTATTQSSVIPVVFSTVQQLLVKYWIFVVGLVLLINALSSPPVDYTCGYLYLFCILVVSLCISFTAFRRTLFFFWTLLIIYSSVILLAVYSYQFPNFPEFWRDLTGLSEQTIERIGLIDYGKDGQQGTLALRLLLPLLLMFVVMLQLKFFHQPWNKLVATPNGTPTGSTVQEDPNATESVLANLKAVLTAVSEVGWRLAEIYLPQVILLILVITASTHICVLSLIVVVFAVLGVCFSRFSRMTSLLLTVYLSILMVARVVYQIHYQDDPRDFFGYKSDDACMHFDNANNETSQTFAEWIGFKNATVVFEYDLIGLIIAIVGIAIHFSVRYRQNHYRRLHLLQTPKDNIIFPDADPKDYDKCIPECFKMLCNYGFYKFGFEINLIMMSVVIWFRMDFIAFLIAAWIILFVILSRTCLRRIWGLFILFLVTIIPLEYVMWVGLPKEACMLYPWSNWAIDEDGSTLTTDNLLRFLDLANYRTTPDGTTSKLLTEFLLLMFAVAQHRVFGREHSDHPAGDNDSVYTNGVFKLNRENPRHDFMTEQRSFVDYFKIAIFAYGHWLTLVFVLVAGLGGTSLFALGYLMQAFFLLWQGNSLYTMLNYRYTLRRWNRVLFYTAFVIMFKVALQLAGCVYAREISDYWGCTFRQLFSIICLQQQSYDNLAAQSITKMSLATCTVDAGESRIGFDILCLAFTIFQIRIFNSYYFQRCMIDFRCEMIQSNRGALLINQLIEKEMKEQNIQQDKKFTEIRTRTAAIRKQYDDHQKVKGTKTYEPKTYGHSKRAGDYFMFDYAPDEDQLKPRIESFVPEIAAAIEEEKNQLGPAQLLHTVIAKDLDIGETMEVIENAENIKDNEQRMLQILGDHPRTQSGADTAHAVSKVLVKKVLDPSHVTTEVTTDPVIDAPVDKAPKTPKPKRKRSKPVLILKFVSKLFRAISLHFITFLNRRSREHRYVAFVLNEEKRRMRSGMLEVLFDEKKHTRECRIEWERRCLRVVNSARDVELLEEQLSNSWQKKNTIAQLLVAFGNCIAAHTDLICYVLACIAMAKNCGLITLPLPLLVFFWGSLSSPRPSRMFWIVMISYTEIIIIVKFIFQFGFFPWNSTAREIAMTKSVYRMQDVIGIQKTDYFAFWDVALLISLFFHRYMLRRLGVWRDANITLTFASLKETSRTTSGNDGDEVGIENIEPPPSTNPFTVFIYNLFHPRFRYIRDLYPIMFFLDVACFFIVVLGFSSFGDGGSGDVINDLSANRVPLTFVIMLVVISFMIVIDRGLYLRKAVYCKFVYQIVSIIFLHCWVFYALPAITQTRAVNNTTAQLLYIVKCVYFVISAWQIRNGYPQLCIGNFLTHSYGVVNMAVFKLYMLIPFLFELRTVIDWTWTDTSMPILDFFNMENFYSVIYSLKCSRDFESAFPTPRAVKKTCIVKYLTGLPVVLFIIIMIWSPLLAFSLLNRIGKELSLDKVQMSVSIEGYPTFYHMEAQGVDILRITGDQKSQMINKISNSTNTQLSRSRRAVSFIEEYHDSDIYRVRFRPVSENFWGVSDDSYRSLAYELTAATNDSRSRIFVNLAVLRERDGNKEPISHTTSYAVDISPSYPPGIWNSLHNILTVSTDQESDPVVLPYIVPYFLLVPNEGQVKAANALEDFCREAGSQPNVPLPNINVTRSSIELRLRHLRDSQQSKVWLLQTKTSASVSDFTTIFTPEKITYITHSNLTYVECIIFVDRVFPDFLLKFAQGGIIAMYMAVVFIVSRFIRNVAVSAPMNVMISEIPNADHLLKICLDIYLVREAQDFGLEQDLYAKLIFLFRSPATLIKWTRHKPKNE